MVEEKPFGIVLRGLRQQARLTMEELAESSGVSSRAIGDMERGRSRVPRQRTVAALADGLGLPDAERQVLLAAARSARPAVPAARTAALPRAAGDFTGRDQELRWLREAAGRAGSGGVASMCVVSGPPGCGKTSLALKAAADLTEEFPDGRVVVDLHGVDGPTDPGEAVSRLLQSLGVPEKRLAQEDAAGRTQLLRVLLSERRFLVVLDNARDEGQIRPFMPAGGRSLVLVTSRRPLSGLENVERLALPEMAQAEAVELLRRIIGVERTEAETEAVGRVAELCGRLPLALRVAGNWLAVRSGWSVSHLVGRLADEERRLAALAAGDVRVEAAFELSYRQLTPPAARMLRLLSLVQGPDMTPAYGAVLTATGLYDAEDVMEELVEAGLLRAAFTGRYQLHDLLRLFARDRLAREEEAGERESAEDRLRTWLLETAAVAGRWYEPAHGAPPTSGQDLVPLHSADEARVWLQQEAPAWLGALRGAARRGENAQVMETAAAMERFRDQWPYWGHWPEVFRLSSESAATLDDPLQQAVHLNLHAWALVTCEPRYREAVQRAGEALECARRAEDVSQQAAALLRASWAHGALGELQQAADKSRVCIELSEAAGDTEGQLSSSMTYRSYLRLLGRAEEALALHEPIGILLDSLDGLVSGHSADLYRAKTMSALGRDCAALGRWAEAADQFRGSLLRIQRLDVPHVMGSMLLDIGRAMIELGDTGEARSPLHRLVALGDAADGADVTAAEELLDSLPGE